MYATNDRIIDASQKWDTYLTEKDISKINNCPIWNRLTCWDTMQDGHVITCGSDTIFDYLLPAQREGFTGLQKYSIKVNKDFYTLLAIVKAKYPKDEIRHGAFYNPAILDKICARYWPDENLIKHSEAMGLIGKAWRLPAPVWHMGLIRYYDKKAVEAEREKMLAHAHEMRHAAAALRAEQSKKNKKAYNETRNEKRRKQREESKKTRQLTIIPDGLEKLSALSRELGVGTSTANSAARRGACGAVKIEGAYYCKRSDFVAYLKTRAAMKAEHLKRLHDSQRGKAKPYADIVPPGFIPYKEALKVHGIASIRLTRLVIRGNIPNVIVRGRHFVDAERLKERIEYEEKTPRDVWSNQHKRGVGKLEGYYSVDEAMEKIHKSRGVLHKHLKHGKIQGVKKNGVVYIEIHSLLNFYGLNQGSLFEEGAN